MSEPQRKITRRSRGAHRAPLSREKIDYTEIRFDTHEALPRVLEETRELRTKRRLREAPPHIFNNNGSILEYLRAKVRAEGDYIPVTE